MENRNTGYETERDERREIRRQRRIRSQIIAYVLAGIVFVCLVFGGALAIRGIGSALISLNSAAALASTEEASVEAENVAATSPMDISVDVAVQETDVLDGIVDTCISSMPLEDKVAGLFFIAPEQLTGVEAVIKAGTATQDALMAYPVGGLFYTSKNMKDEAQLSEMIASTKEMSKYPLFVGTCEVGGSSSQIANALGLGMPQSPSELAATGNADEAYNTANTVSDYMNKYGFNTNLGINANLSEGETSFGTDSQVASMMIGQTVSGLKNFGVSACLQYFPQMSDDGSSIDDLASRLEPFKAGIDAGAPMIMVCTAPSQGVTGDDTPSCLSSVIMQDVLRNQLGFNGIIITDSLNDGNITEKYSAGDAAIAAINAGADMIFIPSDFTEAYTALLTAVQNGTISEDRINESLHRIYRVKYADKAAEIAE